MLKYLIFWCCLGLLTQSLNANELNQLELIGKEIFFDQQLSDPVGMSCGTCHISQKAFSNNKGVHLGADQKLSVIRNTPSIAYASLTPKFTYETIEGNIVPKGGLFWDGKVDSLEEQVMLPFTNKLEMGIVDLSDLARKIKRRPYYNRLLKYSQSASRKKSDVIKSVKNALTVYLKSSEFNKFNSKFDLWQQRKTSLTATEVLGFVLFERVDKGNCAACHTVKMQHSRDRPMLTDFTYDNIGVPANPHNPFYKNPKHINPLAEKFIDYGLGQSDRVKDSKYLGMFKVPSLRNVALTAPYMHNGVFKTLREVVEFYNSRDLESRWGKPEVPYNVNDAELGDLALTENEIDALVAFMKTLTDDYEE